MIQPSTWTALRNPVFRRLWVANVISGTWVSAHDTAATWTMNTLSPSPFLISLIASVASLPFFLFTLPAGALADLVDRRKLLCLMNLWLATGAAGLAILGWLHLLNPYLILACVFFIGVGFAFNSPAFASIVPQVVSDAELPSAVILGGLQLNISGIIGPTLGGLLVPWLGPNFVFAINGACFLLVILALLCIVAAAVFWSWRNPAPRNKTELPVLGTAGEFQLVAEDGRAISRSFLQGRITVCQLVCSRCGNPSPLLLSRFAELDQNFHRSRQLQLLSVTTDPLVDQPPVLARLRQEYEGSSHWVFVTGEASEIARFAAGVFGTAPDLRGSRLRRTATDVPLLVLVDDEARIRQRYQGLDQEVVAAILDDVGSLLRNRRTSAK